MKMIKINENSVCIERYCDIFKTTSQMCMNISPEQFMECYIRWQNGELIQNAFPMLSADEREFILTGITPDQWNSMF